MNIDGTVLDLRLIGSAALAHHLRQGWRNDRMRSTLSHRRRAIAAPANVDAEALRTFVDEQRGIDRARARRCVVAAEPTPERLAHLGPFAPGCMACGIPQADTQHILWHCTATAAMRSAAGFAEGGPEQALMALSQAAAWLQNGWISIPSRPPLGLDFTLAALFEQARALAPRLRASSCNGSMAIATDAAGYLPAQPVFRVTAWAIAWAPTAMEAPAAEVFACPSPHGDTSIATAELLAAVIAALASEMAGVHVLHITDHCSPLSIQQSTHFGSRTMERMGAAACPASVALRVASGTW